MKAIEMRETGGPDVLRLVERPMAELTEPTEMLVRLAAAGVNPIDTKVRTRGVFVPDGLPAVFGCDGAGVVEAVGDGVEGFKPGDEVWFCHGGLGGPQGNYAEYALVDESVVQPKPAGLDFVHAAAAPLVLITAWEALFDRADVTADKTVLIHAGAGGVGHAAIQIARLAGARVAATVSGPEKADSVHGLGAEYAINYREEDLVEAVMDWTEARSRNLRIGFELMLTPMLRNLPEARSRQGEILRRCADWIDRGELRIEVERTFPLEQAAEAHKAIELGPTRGKLALVMD